ncbi:MAG: NAD(P)-dependent oxidoreductase [Alphaproteobacteria bacterium]|nr:NAD(P)-dependent oxidoreductase [Alphaproteobacteria bacterium]
MKTFPMFIKTTGQRVAIVGNSEAAAAKLRLLLKTDAAIVLFALDLDPDLTRLVSASRVAHLTRWPDAADLSGFRMAFVATRCAGANRTFARLAAEMGALVNVVDDPDASMAYTPSIVDRDPVVIAIGTEGTAPLLGRRIKSRIETLLDIRIGRLAALAGRLRGRVAAQVARRDRRDFWAWVFDGAPGIALATGDEAGARRMIEYALDSNGRVVGEAGGDGKGRVTVVATPPSGHPDLISVRAVQHLQEADEILHCTKVESTILEFARRDACRIELGLEDPRWKAHMDAISVSVRAGSRIVILLDQDGLADHLDGLVFLSRAVGKAAFEFLSASNLDRLDLVGPSDASPSPGARPIPAARPYIDLACSLEGGPA